MSDDFDGWIEYIKKDGDWIEFGKRSTQGKRNDLLEIKEKVKNFVPIGDIINECSNYQQMRCAEKLAEHRKIVREKPIVKWYYGKTGSGKTKTAFEELNDPWVSGKNLKWWNGYDCQTDIIIDDFRGDFCTFHELLRILDRYPYTVEIKGGHRPLNAKRIIITCPYPPQEVYESREDIEQLLRRIDEIKEFGPRPEVGSNTRSPTSGKAIEEFLYSKA